MKNLNFICTDKLGENLSHTRVLALVESFSTKPVITYHLDDISFHDASERIPYINTESGTVEEAKNIHLKKLEEVENHTVILYGFTRCTMKVLNMMTDIMFGSDKNNRYIIINSKQESDDMEMFEISLLNRFAWLKLSDIFFQ